MNEIEEEREGHCWDIGPVTVRLINVGRLSGERWLQFVVSRGGLYTNVGPWLFDVYPRRD